MFLYHDRYDLFHRQLFLLLIWVLIDILVLFFVRGFTLFKSLDISWHIHQGGVVLLLQVRSLNERSVDRVLKVKVIGQVRVFEIRYLVPSNIIRPS